MFPNFFFFPLLFVVGSDELFNWGFPSFVFFFVVHFIVLYCIASFVPSVPFCYALVRHTLRGECVHGCDGGMTVQKCVHAGAPRSMVVFYLLKKSRSPPFFRHGIGNSCSFFSFSKFLSTRTSSFFSFFIPPNLTGFLFLSFPFLFSSSFPTQKKKKHN